MARTIAIIPVLRPSWLNETISALPFRTMDSQKLDDKRRVGTRTIFLNSFPLKTAVISGASPSYPDTG